MAHHGEDIILISMGPTWPSSSSPPSPSTSMSPRNQPNVSDEERDRYLELLQRETTQALIPTVVFLSTVALVGLFGNSMVLAVHFRKSRRNAIDIFIMAIAVFDLITNVLAIPDQIYDTFHQWNFDQPSLCKFRHYVKTYTTMSSALILFAVAISRYRKVCRPFGKQTSTRAAKIVAFGCGLLAGVFAAPQAVLYGSQTVPTPRDDIFGQKCATDDTYINTIWPVINTGFLTVLFLGSCIPLIVLNVLIGIKARRQIKFSSKHSTYRPAGSSDGILTETLSLDNNIQGESYSREFKSPRKIQQYENSCDVSSTDDELVEMNVIEMKNTKNDKNSPKSTGKKRQFETAVDVNMNDNIDSSNDSLKAVPPFVKEPEITDRPGVEINDGLAHNSRDNRSARLSPKRGTHKKCKPMKKHREGKLKSRTTTKLIIISAVYVIVFVPYLVLLSCKLTVPNFLESMSAPVFAMCSVFLKFYYLNSAANAIVYGFCDAKFREEAWKICSCRH